MKVTFKYGIGSFAGTVDLGTYWATPKGTASYMRRYVKPETTAHNTAMGSAMKNLSSIWKSANAEYKSDFSKYADRYYEANNDLNDPFDRKLSNFSWFLKMMYSFAETNEGSVDLTTIALNDMTSLFLDTTTVKSCVDAHFLPAIPVYDDLANSMDPS